MHFGDDEFYVVFQNKASLDENGNPVMSTSSGSTNSTVLAGDRPGSVLQTTSRKNVINLKDASRFDRVKARNDKKKVRESLHTLLHTE